MKNISHRQLLTSAVALATASLAGCGGDGLNRVGSSQVDTRNILASVTATAQTNGIVNFEAQLQLATDADAVIELESGESITVTQNGGSASVELDRSPSQGGAIYEGSLDFNGDASGESFTLALDRRDEPSGEGLWFPEDVLNLEEIEFGDIYFDANDTTLTLPQEFTSLDVPTGEVGDNLPYGSRTDTVELVWAPTSNLPLSVDYSTTCPPPPSDNSITRTGTVNLSGDTGMDDSLTIADFVPSELAGTNCTINLTLVRTQEGSADPLFNAGSRVVGRQAISTSLSYQPVSSN